MSRNQVPVEATSQVISGIIRELAQQEVDFPPDKLTISQFSHELGVISDLQVGEVLVHNDNLTLAWDATSIDADHLNEVHVLIFCKLEPLQAGQPQTTHRTYSHQ